MKCISNVSRTSEKGSNPHSYAEIFSCHWLKVKGDKTEGSITKIIDKAAANKK